MHLGNLDWKGFVVLVDRCHESGKEDPEAPAEHLRPIHKVSLFTRPTLNLASLAFRGLKREL